MKKKIVLITFLTALAVNAKDVVLTWTDTLNPPTTTYSVYRAQGLCSGSPVFSKVANGVTTKNYTDAAVPVGNYCYQVTATFSGLESGPSNQAAATVPPAAPTTLSIVVQ